PLLERSAAFFGLDRPPQHAGALVVVAGVGDEREVREGKGRRVAVADGLSERKGVERVRCCLVCATEPEGEVGERDELDRFTPLPGPRLAGELEAFELE